MKVRVVVSVAVLPAVEKRRTYPQTVMVNEGVTIFEDNFEVVHGDEEAIKMAAVQFEKRGLDAYAALMEVEKEKNSELDSDVYRKKVSPGKPTT